MVGVVLLAIFSLILKYGFYLSDETRAILYQLDMLIAGIFVAEFLLKLALSGERKVFLKGNRIDFFLVFLFLFFILSLRGMFALSAFTHLRQKIGIFSWPQSLAVICQIYIIASLLLRLPQLNKIIAILRIKPPLVVVLTFISIIAVGTLLLLLPRSTIPGKATTFMDALFTATSATCVTGLIVVDTGSHFSLLGQLVILFLIQVGGLGLMTFTSFFALSLGKGFGVKDRVLLRGILNYGDLGKIGSLILSIFAITFIIEAVGALLLYTQFLPYHESSLSPAYSAIFHSISAFCNAGFSLFSDSFRRYQSDTGINFIMSSLIVLGGLGFIVIVNLWRWGYAHLKGKRGFLSLQSKLVLSVSFLLIAGGMGLILLGEKGGALESFSLKEKLLGAYFQSITARTAGFNTLNIGTLSIFSALLLLIFMFIGASPGSTGGGVKTSTFATLFLTIKSMIQGKSRVEVFKRTIPRLIVYQALSVVILALGWIAFSTLFLTLTEHASFMDILFEDLSAFGTVGLSRGLTPHLTMAGRVIIILTMLIGRIGPLTLALTIGVRRVSELYEYPEERVMIG